MVSRRTVVRMILVVDAEQSSGLEQDLTTDVVVGLPSVRVRRRDKLVRLHVRSLPRTPTMPSSSIGKSHRSATKFPSVETTCKARNASCEAPTRHIKSALVLLPRRVAESSTDPA